MTRLSPSVRSPYLRISVLVAVVIAAASIGSAVFALVRHASDGIVRAVLAGVAGGTALMLIAALSAARSAGMRRASRHVSSARELTLPSQAEPRPPAPPVSPPVRTVEVPSVRRPDQHVEIFVNLARRMQTLVHREIELLDELEAKVEDPDLLKGLFTVDHLATRMRRQSESLAVLGGSTSRRQWTRQVTMHEVLRASVAEIEQYSRVKVVPPVDGMLRGDAVADVIHLVAELVENATKFSAPRTQVLLRAQEVAAGLAIDVEDRGLGMLAQDQQRMNAVLADPGQIDIDDLLRDGRIGLFVVSTLARRHGIRVQLQGNIYGGTQAVVVLPHTLVNAAEREYEPAQTRELVTAADTAVPLGSLEALSLPRAAAPVARPQTAPPGGDRPPLPRRQVQTHLAPELRARRSKHDASRYVEEPPADQITGLMADFLRGVSRSDDEN